MFDEMSIEQIKSRLIAAAQAAGWSTDVGTMVDYLVAPMAVEIAKCYRTMEDMVPKFWVDGTSGAFIELAANELGIYRNAGNTATCAIAFEGRVGLDISAGTLWLTDDGLEFALDSTVTLDAVGQGTGILIAAGVGSQYNITQGELIRMHTNILGLTKYTNADAEGGVDVEPDSALYARLESRRKQPATSGNAAHYAQWATDVAGVGFAKIRPLWAGAGTVSVLLTGADGGTADSVTVDAVAEHIEALRPIGATVTVASAQAVVMNVMATIVIDSTTTIERVREQFVSKLDTYLFFLTQSWVASSGAYTLLYNRVMFLLLDVDGVVDCTALTVNGGELNVSIAVDEITTLGTVVLS